MTTCRDDRGGMGVACFIFYSAYSIKFHFRDAVWNGLDGACARPPTRDPDRPLIRAASRTLLLQPDSLPDGISPNGRSMAEEKARVRSHAQRNPRRFTGNITLQKSRQQWQYRTDRWSRVKGGCARRRRDVTQAGSHEWTSKACSRESVHLSVPTRFSRAGFRRIMPSVS